MMKYSFEISDIMTWFSRVLKFHILLLEFTKFIYEELHLLPQKKKKKLKRFKILNLLQKVEFYKFT